MKRWLGLVGLALWVPLVWADYLPIVRKDAPQTYIVKKGDTLWDISSYFLDNPWLWPKLWHANSYIKNPHLIYPGDRLRLRWVKGQPQLVLDRGKAQVKLTPKMRIASSPITTLHDSLMFPYLAEDKLLSAQSLENVARVIGSSDGRSYMAPGDTIWVDSVLDGGSEWWIYRINETFTREGEGTKHQVMALQEVAKARVKAIDKERSLLRLTQLRQEIHQNDLVLPAPIDTRSLNMSFAPTVAPSQLQAQVVGSISGQQYMASKQVIILDRGHLDNFEPGQVFKLYRDGADISGPKGEYAYHDSRFSGAEQQLKHIEVGEVMVLRPYEYFSLAVVTKSFEPFKAGVVALPPTY